MPPAQAHVNSFVAWAKENAVDIESVDPLHDNGDDLRAVAAAIGEDIEIVALSEGCHNSRQMMSLHHRIVRHLVEHCGFNVVATETGLPESRLIHDYVQNRPVTDVEVMYKSGLNKMYSEWQEGRELVEWMRSYNQGHGNKLHYYGLDIGGFYENWKLPMDLVYAYLRSVDPKFGQTLQEKLAPFLNVMSVKARINYNEKLSALERTQLAVHLQEAVEHFDQNEEEYVSRSLNRSEFEWARQSIISMRLAEHYYRNILDTKTSRRPLFSGLNGRETAMHQNMMWVLETRKRQLRPGEKLRVIWINHVIHTKTETQYHDNTWRFLTPAGQMISEAVGREKLFVIGMAYAKGSYWRNWQRGLDSRSVDVVPEPKGGGDGLEPILSTVRRSNYYLHLDKMPTQYSPFSNSALWVRENDYFIKIALKEWNACIYLNETDPATPHSEK